MPDPPLPQSAAQNVSANLICLNTAVQQIEELQETTKDQQNGIAKMKAVEEKHCAKITVIFNTLNIKNHVAFLGSISGAVEVENNPNNKDFEIVAQVTDDFTDEEWEKLSNSIKHLLSWTMSQTTVNKVYAHLLGITGKTPVARKLPPHPNWPGEVFPLNPATKTLLVHFYWDKPGSFKGNIHLEKHVKKKFRYLHLLWFADPKENEGPDEDGPEPQAADNIFGDSSEGSGKQASGGGGKATQSVLVARKTEKMQSALTYNLCITSKLAILIQKQVGHTTYPDPKYDAAFTLAVMSKDKTDDKTPPGMPKGYKTCPLDWQSEELKTCHKQVNARVNPGLIMGTKLALRRQGKVKQNTMPQKALKIVNTVRLWMDPIKLAAHPEWVPSKKQRADQAAGTTSFVTKKQKRKAVNMSEIEKQTQE
ncbi:hypothetical protein C8Q80DRAFT_1268914 [Daedaleopsis nitida]|nr:hypothetical protein C8Q80DRAFT_1268914 [Daedaleopsis nitida]